MRISERYIYVVTATSDSHGGLIQDGTAISTR